MAITSKGTSLGKTSCRNCRWYSPWKKVTAGQCLCPLPVPNSKSLSDMQEFVNASLERISPDDGDGCPQYKRKD